MLILFKFKEINEKQFENIESILVSDKVMKFVKFKNFNIIGWYYDKPLTYIDLSSCLSVELESVNVRSWHENTETYTAFYETPNSECTGIRVGRGNQYGIQKYPANRKNHIRRSEAGKIYFAVKTHHADTIEIRAKSGRD